MYYILIWLIVWLLLGANSFSLGSGVFWSFIVALIADLVVHGWPYIIRRP